MVSENTIIPEEEKVTEETSKLSLHIYLTSEGYQKIKKWAEYAALEGLIEGHVRGNFSSYCNFCFQLGESFLKQHILKKRGYK